MLYRTMQLVYRALDRGILVRRKVHNGYLSEGFVILLSGGIFHIQKGNKTVSIGKDTHYASKEGKEFKLMLKSFLDITFPD